MNAAAYAVVVAGHVLVYFFSAVAAREVAVAVGGCVQEVAA